MVTRHLDLGCGPCPRNPYGRDEAHAVDLALPEDLDPQRFRRANLSVEPIPHPDSSFDSVSAFDFLEHIPRVLGTPDGRGTRLPFIDLMNDIHRVLKPGGRFYAVTPAYPRAQAFQDPTHVNFIGHGTWEYFCGANPGARLYGFVGGFEKLRNEWAMHPEAFAPDVEISLGRRFRRWRLQRAGRLSHLLWEFACIKPVV
ncbi:MAG: class I SAM-dependent methyltransferase [Pseudomonadota bacterium]